MSKGIVALDRGHGANTPGKETPLIPELGRRIQEEEFNGKVVNFLKTELERCGFDVLLTAPETNDVPLATRVKRANDWKADIFVSIHFNALDGKFDANDPEGFSVHIYPGHLNKDAGRLAKAVHEALKGGTVQKARGVKENDFFVLRESHMPAILSENGFMDNKREALLMLSVPFQKEVAKEHAQGICKYFNAPYVAEVVKPLVKESQSQNTSKTFFRVVTGSFTDRENADARVHALKKAGFDSFIDVFEK